MSSKMVRTSPRLKGKPSASSSTSHPPKSRREKKEARQHSCDADVHNDIELVGNFQREVDRLEAPRGIVKFEQRDEQPIESSSGPSENYHAADAAMSELIVKVEPVDFGEEDFPNTEFSQYEHLLKNITFLKNGGDNESDENCRSDGSAIAIDGADDPLLHDDVEDDGFSCFDCDFTCELRSELAAHLLTHNRPTLKCEICEDVFTKPEALQVHIDSRHPNSELNEFSYHCKFCQQSFSSPKTRANHIRAVHVDKRLFKCTQCPKSFVKKTGLIQHMAFHLDTRPHNCKICNQAFRTRGNLNSHMKYHFEFRQYKCDQCEKEFIRKDQLKRHILSVHKKTCLYKCAICNRSLKGHVLNHLRIHMDEKHYKCAECGKSFVQSSQLTVHMRTHTGDRPYQCKFCEATFSHSSACILHTRIHTGEKPAKCQLCPAAFTQLPHLKKHMRCIHKIDKPYGCLPCNLFFNTKFELQTHTSAKQCNPTSPKNSSPAEQSESKECKVVAS